MSQDFSWEAPPLSSEDERLVNAYVQTGRSLDELAYTPQFEELVRSLGRSMTRDDLHAAYKRLLTLRKMGRLPRLIDVGT